MPRPVTAPLVGALAVALLSGPPMSEPVRAPNDTASDHSASCADAADCSCGPTYCIDVEAARAEKAAKKEQAIRRGLPPRLAAAFDHLPDCVGCVRQAPDWVSITIVYDPEGFEEAGLEPPPRSRSSTWNRDLEQRARDMMREGLVRSFYISIEPFPCRCCPEDEAAAADWAPIQRELWESSDGWIEEAELHEDVVVVGVTDPDELGEDPEDLTTIPEADRRPPLERCRGELPPKVRHVTVQCRECLPIKDEHDQFADFINDLQVRIRALRESACLIAQTIDGIWGELEASWELADTPETAAHEESLYEELAQRHADLDRDQRRIAEFEGRIREFEKSRQEALARLQECEDECEAAAEEESKEDAAAEEEDGGEEEGGDEGPPSGVGGGGGPPDEGDEEEDSDEEEPPEEEPGEETDADADDEGEGEDVGDGDEPEGVDLEDPGAADVLNSPIATGGGRDPTVQYMILLRIRLSVPVGQAAGPAAARATTPLAARLPGAVRPSGPVALDPPPGVGAAPSAVAGAPGVEAYLTSLGTSTGEAFELVVLNTGARPVELTGEGLVVEPVELEAGARRELEERLDGVAGRDPVRTTLTGYCLEFLKRPPAAGRLFRVSPPATQQRYASMRRVLGAAERVREAGGLHPDSDPAGYFDSITQWALWTLEQGFDESGFAEAFLEHTRTNVEGAGHEWTGELESAVRRLVPNRWRDVLAVLEEAGTGPGG